MNVNNPVAKKLWIIVSEHKMLFWSSVLLYFPLTTLMIAEPLVIGKAVEQGFLPHDMTKVIFWSTTYLFVILIQSGFMAVQLFMLNESGQNLVYSLRKKLFSKIQRLPMNYFDKTPLGQILSRITSDAENLSELFSSGAVAIFGDLLFLFATLLMLFFLNIDLSVAVLLILPVLAVGMWLFRVWTKAAYVWVRKSLASLTAFLQEYIAGMQAVQGYGQTKRIGMAFEKGNSEYMKANERAILLDAGVYSFVDALSMLAVVLVLWFGFSLREQGLLQLGVLVAFIEALNRFFFPVRELANRMAIIQSALVSGDRIFSILSLPEEEVAKKSLRENIQFNNMFEFDSVGLHYDSGVKALSDISFKLKLGKRIAFVGPTGAGKSSAIKAATRFYERDSGEIRIDGTNADCFSLRAFRSLFNIVPQDPFLFKGTLRENLLYGCQGDLADGVLENAVKICQFNYILKRPMGLEQQVEAKGQNFSLGERQLIAFARAFVADAPILVLDEATASVDTRTENRLKVATKKLLTGRTAIIIAHRLSTIEDCDEILVFDKGQIVERGNHAELMGQNGLYAKMIELQRAEEALQK